MHVKCFPRSAEDVVFCAAVVVAGGKHYRHIGTGSVEAADGIGKSSLDGSRGLSRMMDIAGKKKDIGLFGSDNIFHLAEHLLLLIGAVVAVEGMSEMPIACMQ